METKKIKINTEIEVPKDFTGGMVDIGTEFTECIPLNAIVWYWDTDTSEYKYLGIYKGVDDVGYLIQPYAHGPKEHYDHIKLYKKEETV